MGFKAWAPNCFFDCNFALKAFDGDGFRCFSVQRHGEECGSFEERLGVMKLVAIFC